jgi:signal transduction histidine kinase/HAMP domain-containing protein
MKFLRSLSFKIGSVLILTEIAILMVVNIVYVNRFSEQIDKRIEDRIQLPGEMVNSSLVRLISIRDADSLRLLVGEDIVDAFLIDTNQQEIIYSLQNQYTGQAITEVSQLNPAWFSDENTKILKRTSEGDNNFLVSVTPIQDQVSGTVSYYLYIKTSTNEAEAEKTRTVQLLALGSFGTVLLTFFVIFLSFRFMIFKRLASALNVLGRIEEGELVARIDNPSSQDEIGSLQRSVNSMATKREQAERSLNQLNQELEERVTARTRDLQVAADVSKQVTTVLDLSTLLPQLVELTRTGFRLYHVSMFLINNEQLELVAATGQQNAASSLANPLVSRVARDRTAIILNNTLTADDYLPNPLLPNTRSEAIFPMTIGTLLVGVLDLQSDQFDRFTPDDVRVLKSLSEQIAVAVRNAQLYTEAQSARQESEKANQVKSQFLANMSHELRTPLNAILNFTAFVANGVLGPVNTEQVEALNESIASGKHLLSLINDVLDITKIEAGMMDLFVEEVDINAILSATLSVTKGLIKDKPIQLDTQIASDLPSTFGDKRRLRQVFINLVSNAVKFTSEGSVSIIAKHDNGGVEICVRDTGTGIAPEDQEAIFEPFKQARNNLKDAVGTGLGFPICKYLLE